ncbi:unnamed protein product [Pylaiella littoralis]
MFQAFTHVGRVGSQLVCQVQMCGFAGLLVTAAVQNVHHKHLCVEAGDTTGEKTVRSRMHRGILCRPVTSFAAKDGGVNEQRRTGKSLVDLTSTVNFFSQDLYLKCTPEFFRELIGKEQERAVM